MIVMQTSGRITSGAHGSVESNSGGFACSCGLCHARVELGRMENPTSGRSASHNTLKQRALVAVRERHDWRYDKQLGWLCTTCKARDDINEFKRGLKPLALA